MLLDLILFPTTPTAPYRIFNAVKIKRVSVWGLAGLGTPSTVEVVFDGTTVTGDQSVHTDTSLGVLPACVHARPKKSIAGLWNVASTNTAFTLRCPAGSIIDVELNLKDIMGDAEASSLASVGATVGEIFYRGLDGQPVATSNYTCAVLPQF
jgi:hypothetical protein